MYVFDAGGPPFNRSIQYSLFLFLNIILYKMKLKEFTNVEHKHYWMDPLFIEIINITAFKSRLHYFNR